METKENIIYFESDEEFEDFCIAPFGVIEYGQSGSPFWKGLYSDQYTNAIQNGMRFVIKNEDSTVYKRMCVTKRVPIQGTSRTAPVQLPVQNLEPYFDDSRHVLKRRRNNIMATIKTSEDLVKAYKDYLVKLDRKKELNDISERKIQNNEEVIPLIEVSGHFNSASNDQSRKILFVGFNPSGADLEYYRQNNNPLSPGKPDDVLIYDGDSNYYKTMESFAEDCKDPKDCNSIIYSVLDVFGIVRKTQSAIVVHFLNNPSLYTPMLDIFLNAIKGINPTVIIVANAFVRKLFIANTTKLHCSPKRKDPVVDKLRENIKENKDLKRFYDRFTLSPNVKNGGYTLSFDNETFQLFFSCMLSGQRAIDLGNRENLIWLIKNYIISLSR